MSQIATVEPAKKVEPRQRPKQEPPYHVVLLNDEEHTFEYVIEMMQRLFGYPQERGYQIALTVHTEDRAIVLTTTREHAELKRDQIHAYGADTRIRGCKGSMSAVIEPAPESG